MASGNNRARNPSAYTDKETNSFNWALWYEQQGREIIDNSHEKYGEGIADYVNDHLHIAYLKDNDKRLVKNFMASLDSIKKAEQEINDDLAELQNDFQNLANGNYDAIEGGDSHKRTFTSLAGYFPKPKYVVMLPEAYDTNKNLSFDSFRNSNKNTENTGYRKDFNHTNNTTKVLNALGPDLLKHRFTAMMLWDNLSNDDFTDYERSVVFSNSGFAIRTCSVTIPHTINQSFSLQALGTQIEKVRSSKETSHIAVLNIRLDQNVAWIKDINRVIGLNNTIDEAVADNGLYEGINRKNWKSSIFNVATCWSKGGDVKDAHNRLLVAIETNSSKNIQPVFVFDDVRFTGINGSLTYNRDSPEPQTVPFEFLFKSKSLLYLDLNGVIKVDE